MPEIQPNSDTALKSEISPKGSGDFLQLKEEGNKLFAAGDFKGAVKVYSKGLRLCEEKSPEKVVLLKNRSAAYLKLEEYKKVVSDTTAALEISPSDVKALFRRCQANQQLQQYNEAFKDARTVLHLEPQNKAVIPFLSQLNVKMQEIAKEQTSIVNKVKNMFEFLLGEDTSMENRIQAANNLLVLAREKAGAELIMRESGVMKLLAVMKLEKHEDISIAVIRTIGELCKRNPERTVEILKQIGLPFFIENLNSESDQYVSSVQYVIQTVINSLSGMELQEGKKINKDLMKQNESAIDSLMLTLVKNVSSRVMSAIGRDSILELIMKNADYEALDWGKKLVDQDGLWPILEVASELQELHYESCMKITGLTLTHASVTQTCGV